MRPKVILVLSVLLAMETYLALFLYTLKSETHDDSASLPMSVSQTLWQNIEDAMLNPPCSRKIPLVDKMWKNLAFEAFHAQNYALETQNVTLPVHPVQHDLVAFLITTDFTPHYASAASFTWGTRIGQLYVVAENTTLKLPSIITGLTRDVDNAMAGWKYLYKHELENYKWFARMHERNYVFVDSLMEHLSQYNHNTPYYLGYVVSTSEGSFCAPTAGYILSKKALQIIGPQLYSVKNFEREEDWMKNLMKKNDISPQPVPGVNNNTLLQYMISNPNQNPIVLSTQAKQMFELEYFLHGFKP